MRTTSSMNQSQKVSVAGFLFHKGKVLVVRRSKEDEFLAGYFELPGGSVDFGEEVETALVREFEEEVGLEVTPLKLLRIMSWIAKEKNQHTHELVYLVECKQEPKVVLSEEHDEFKWISFEEIGGLEPITKEIKENLTSGFSMYGKEHVIPGTYLHYKGKEYEVLENALHSETLETMVVYRAKYTSELGENVVFVRPTHLFAGQVLHEGKSVPRFKRLN